MFCMPEVSPLQQNVVFGNLKLVVEELGCFINNIK